MLSYPVLHNVFCYSIGSCDKEDGSAIRTWSFQQLSSHYVTALSSPCKLTASSLAASAHQPTSNGDHRLGVCVCVFIFNTWRPGFPAAMRSSSPIKNAKPIIFLFFIVQNNASNQIGWNNLDWSVYLEVHEGQQVQKICLLQHECCDDVP